MVENARKPYDGFMGTRYAKLLGLVLAFAVSFAILALLGTKFGLYMFVGIILYVIPRLFHVKDYKAMAVLGAVFLLASTLIGGMAFTAPAMNSHTTDDMDGYGFTDIQITDDGDSYTFVVNYSGSGDPDVALHYGPVLGCCFGAVGNLTTDIVNKTMEKTQDMPPLAGTKYSVSGIEIPDGTPYYIYFTADDVTSERGLLTVNVTDGQITSFAVKTNFSTILLPVIAFYIILVVMFVFNRKVEKVRTEMEAEGRLYPQGMGRCKECGMVILPGETVCRKCGAVIDVPEEYRRKPAPGPENQQSHFECSECGAKVPADSKTCPNCGAVFDEDEE